MSAEKYHKIFEEKKCCVLIPTYNNASVLPEVIKDVLNYTFNIILVNDGSTDNTLELLEELLQNSTFIHGKMDAVKRQDAIEQFNTEKNAILIGSTIFDEGIDFSSGVDCLIIASGGKSFRKTIQRLGRALRKNSQGLVEVYDFNDKDSKYLERHSRSRKKAYELEGHKVKSL